MTPISVLKNSNASIIYEIPQGKPDTGAPCLANSEIRDRIKRNGSDQKSGGHCWYYAMKLIRREIGKEPCPELLTARAYEKICSERRKALTAFALQAPIELADFFIASDFLKTITLDQVRHPGMVFETIFSKKSGEHSFLEKLANFRVNQQLFIIELFLFSRQTEHANLYAFLENKRMDEIFGVNMAFIRKVMSPECVDKIESILHQYRSLKERASVTDLIARTESARLYGLQTSSWAPFQPVGDLIDELKNYGPLMVCGTFSEHNRRLWAIIKNPVSDREIYLVTLQIHTSAINIMHAIVLIGATTDSETGHSYVYFIDPNDPSDPNNASLQKIYKISFQNFIKNTSFLIKGDGQFFNCDNIFAYRGCFKLPHSRQNNYPAFYRQPDFIL